MKSWLATGLILATTLLSVPTPLLGQDDSEALRKEIADLKREVDLLTRERDLLTQELKMLKTGSKESKPEPAPEGMINGTFWEIQGLGPKGNPITPAYKFHALQGKVFVAGKEVGTYTDLAGTSVLKVTGITDARFNGRYEFQHLNEVNSVGSMTNLQGNRFQVSVKRLLK